MSFSSNNINMFISHITPSRVCGMGISEKQILILLDEDEIEKTALEEEQRVELFEEEIERHKKEREENERVELFLSLSWIEFDLRKYK